MREWLFFVPAWALALLTVVLGLAVMASLYVRMRQLDRKVDRIGWVVAFALLLAGVYWTVLGDPWGSVLLLAGVLWQQSLSRQIWANGCTPDQLLFGKRSHVDR